MLVGVDLTEYCEIVIEHALDQAARHDSPELHFLYVKEERKRSAEELKQRLSAIVYPSLQTFNQYGTNWRARLHVRRGKPADQIAILAADVRADLVVIGQFGLHHAKHTVKSVTSCVLQHAPCPALIVGMPQALDQSLQCPACAAVRDDTEGERWFCEGHTASERIDHTVTPMSVWTGGSVMW